MKIEMTPADETEATGGDTSAAPTQAELFDHLRRIGELEDQKQAVQTEIDKRTEELRSAMSHVDRGSLLYKMLSAALPAPKAKPTTARRTPRKTGTKRARQKK